MTESQRTAKEIPTCTITGHVSGHPDACGDCDPCSASYCVQLSVKRLIAELNEWRAKYEDLAVQRDAAQHQSNTPDEDLIEVIAMDDLTPKALGKINFEAAKASDPNAWMIPPWGEASLGASRQRQWIDGAVAVRNAAQHQSDARISSLAMMIMRLCRRLDRFDPDTKVRNQAVDLLKRYGLCSPLRADIGEVRDD